MRKQTILILALLLILSVNLASAYCSDCSFYDYQRPLDYGYAQAKTDYYNGYKRGVKAYYFDTNINQEAVYYSSHTGYRAYYDYHNKGYYYQYYPTMKTYELHECYFNPPEGKIFYRKCPY